LHKFWILYFAAVAVLSIAAGLRAFVGLRAIPWLANARLLPEGALPMISVIFAARDEAEKLPAALASRLALNYSRYEVIAVNDRSTDATSAILNQFAQTSKLLRVIEVRELPAGWMGKTHALDAGFKASSGEWLVFTDADVHFAPDVLSRAIGLAREREWDHLTLLSGVDMRGVWEIAAISYFMLVFMFGNSVWNVSNPRSPSYVGVGAFQLVRRAAYEAAGGHRRLALEVIDDMKLGKIIKLAGFRSGVAAGIDEVSVRWHAGLGNVIRGVTKNLFAAVRFNIFLAVAAALGQILLCLVPWFGVIFATGWARVFAAIALAALLTIQGGALHAARKSPLYAITQPIGAILFCWMILRSAIVTLWHGGVTWRGTFYPLAELRKGAV
jgi:glycosyltransferase involved in cell wall biosynthesis